MVTSALRSEECNPSPSDVDIGTAPALEVRASYNGVLIGTRFLAAAERLRPVRGQGVQAMRINYTIGQSPGADAPAASEVLGDTDLPLVTRWGAGFLVHVTPRMTGDVAVGEKIYRLADYVAGRGSNFALPADGRARIDCGAMSFHLAHSTRPIPLPRRLFAWHWVEQKFNLGAFLALGIFLLAICAIPLGIGLLLGCFWLVAVMRLIGHSAAAVCRPRQNGACSDYPPSVIGLVSQPSFSPRLGQ